MPVLHNCFSQRPRKAYISTKFVVDVIPYKDKIPTELVGEGAPTKLVGTAYNSESCLKERSFLIAQIWLKLQTLLLAR